MVERGNASVWRPACGASVWRKYRAVLALPALCLTGCFYSAPVDRSAIESAVLLPGGKVIAMAFQNIRYRPAAGIAAFPDGGIPRYLRDREIIATLPVEGGKPRILQRLENEGVHGSASVTLRASDADPDHVLVIRSFQPSTSQADKVQRWRLRWRDASVFPYPDLAADLKKNYRTLGSPVFGDVRVIDSDGTLLIGARAGSQDELWLRLATGAYRRLDAIKHFYGVQGDELYYWRGDEAVVRNWRTGAQRLIARYDPIRRLTTRFLQNDPTVVAADLPDPPPPVQLSFSGRDLTVKGGDGARATISVNDLLVR
jgi:hypothetical protein